MARISRHVLQTLQLPKDDSMSTSCLDRDDETFIVVVNDEDQYSIWPHWKAIPSGWTAVPGVQGDKATVLAHVELAWTDMRPRSLRDWMDRQAVASPSALAS